VYDREVTARKLPIYQDQPIPEHERVKGGPTTRVAIESVEDKSKTQVFRDLKLDLIAFGYKLIDLVTECQVALKNRLKKKEVLKKSTGVTMADGTQQAGPSKETIDQLVAAEVKRQIKVSIDQTNPKMPVKRKLGHANKEGRTVVERWGKETFQPHS
jgi:hypothetical protein